MTEEPNDLAALSIRRPLLVLILNLLIALAGLAALFGVEVRELPDVDRPIISVNATFPGASPETMDAEVTRIIEGAVARVTGVRSISSSSEENTSRIRVEFRPGVDLDSAASDVREAVSRVTRDLPEDVEQLTVRKADDDAEPIVTLAAYSDSLTEEELTRVIEDDILPEFVSISGVADVTLFGNRQRLLRVVLDPLRLTSHGLSVTDVADVLRNAPFDVPAGSFRSDDQELVVRADATVVTAKEVEELMIGDTTRIGDIADVYFGPEDAMSLVRLNGRPVIGLGVIRQAQSNTIDISEGVKIATQKINERFDNLEVVVTSDDAIFIRGSVNEVVISLLLTVCIVVFTIWLFLGSLRATLVPSVSIPIALIGTLAAIWLLGFSINILTLLALVLATGLIVDDSIVVLENIQRRRAQGLGARAAAVLGTRQVFFAVVTTTAVLVSVFVPISFLPSTAGRLFREFGFVLAFAVAISSFVSLSLVPTMAARVVAHTGETHRFFQPLARTGRRCQELYESALRRAVAAPFVVIGIALLSGFGAWLLHETIAQELVPVEDRGTIFIRADGPDGVGLGYTDRQTDKVEAILQPYLQSGEIESVLSIVGRWDLNRAQVTAPLAPWGDRERSQQDIIEELTGPLSEIPGARVRAYGSNSLDIGGSGGANEIEVALIGNDYGAIYEAARVFARRIETDLPNLYNVEISYEPTQPQLSVEIDRRRAADLGIPLDDLAATLRTMIDGDDLGDLNVDDQAVPIFLEANTGAINDPTDLVNLYVRTQSGGLVPLSSVVSLREEGVAAELDRYAQSRAIEVEAAITPGYPLASAVEDLRRLAADALPSGVSMVLQGEAETLEETSSEVTLTYALALLVVFLVLVAQFENVTSALVVIATVPFGIAAAIYALFLTGTSVNIYSQIGLVMLIGLMAKNGILLVEFADQLRDRGLNVVEAMLTSARVRLRPLAMTMFSTIFGGLPLILSGGPGAEARESIGWVVFGGLGLAAVFTLFLAPVLYVGLAGLAKPRAHETARLAREMKEAEAIPDHDGQSPS